MANWDILKGRGSVDDRRGLGGGVAGVGIGGIALLLALNYLNGGSVGDVLPTILNQIAAPQSQSVDPAQFAGEDEYETFAATVLGSANEVWEQKIPNYQPPTLVLFRGATASSCGGASSATGPHYCPVDDTIYLDETFFDELTARLGGSSGDVAQAYVIAHEVGHAVQDQLGTSQRVQQDGSNEALVALELQADCYAGIWAHSIRDQGVFGPGEIQEALLAAAAVGDDNIQERTTGRVNPETWTHGSSEARVSWFNRGFETGSVESCNTFAS